jgi:hypothetical protein
LFIWYAGHGDTVNGEGYLIPVDGVLQRDSSNFLRRSLSLRRFGDFVRLARSKHVYTVFDSCFAGTIFNVARSAPPPAITRVTAEPVRQFLSSGDAGQTVSDDGTFATLFVDAIRGKRRSDLNGDGYITASEMGAFLTDSVANYTNNKQVPRQGKLNDPKYDTGDFVFLASITTPPKIQQSIAPTTSAFSLDAIMRQADKRKAGRAAWDSKLQDMSSAHTQVQALDGDSAVETELKISAWTLFAEAFAEDNPYSTTDNSLRTEAASRIVQLQQGVGTTAPLALLRPTIERPEITDREHLLIVRVQPKYPPQAARDGVEGWVLVEFTVNTLGSVEDVSVINHCGWAKSTSSEGECDNNYARMFDREAKRALRKFKYQPKTREGEPVQRAGLQYRFDFTMADG